MNKVKMCASSENVVDLGFIEECEDWKLLSHCFPNKIGGKPAWLSLKSIPGVDSVSCSLCGEPCVFLMQVYAPVEDIQDCFHRTIYLFICKEPKCFNSSQSNSCYVLRSQLPRLNDFYSDKPPSLDVKNDGHYPAVDKYEKLCVVCGCAGTKMCSKCHSVTYCSRHHQVLDWKNGHKSRCTVSNTDGTGVKSAFILPQFGLEVTTEQSENENEEKTDAQKLSEYQDFLKSKSAKGLMKDVSDKDFAEMSKKEDSEDKAFRKFQEIIKSDPDQVLRYGRGCEPLLVASDGKPPSIPDCSCGASRQFEFQVMPQLISHLKLDDVGESIDWGTILVYTCSQNCAIGNAYSKEYAWKQDFTNTDDITPK